MNKVRRLTILVSTLGVVAMLAGCGGADERAPEWGYIAPIILAPNCATASCHSEAAAASGLDLSTPERAYKSLTGLKVVVSRPGDLDDVRQPLDCDDDDSADHNRCLSPRGLVTPFAPDQSLLVKMLWADGAPRMPPDRPLPWADIELIERWILAGAQCPECDTGNDDEEND